MSKITILDQNDKTEINSSISGLQTTATNAQSRADAAYTLASGKADASHAHTEYVDASHTHAASTITAGTFAGNVVAPTGTDYTTARIRNIKASTTDLTAGSSSLTSGDIYLVYE